MEISDARWRRMNLADRFKTFYRPPSAPAPQLSIAVSDAPVDHEAHEADLRRAKAMIEIEAAERKLAEDAAAEKAHDERRWRRNSALGQFLTTR